MNGPLDRKDTQVEHLRQVAQQRRTRTETLIREAVQTLDRQRKPITVAAVAKQAGVTRQTVYNSPFRPEIEALRARTAVKVRGDTQTQATEASLRRRLELAHQESERLKAERDKLRKALNDVLAQQRRTSQR